MILDSSSGPIVMSTLRCWDDKDKPIGDIIWFNPDTLMASAKRSGHTAQRTRVGRFCFRVFSRETAAQLRGLLPRRLYGKIEVLDDRR